MLKLIAKAEIDNAPAVELFVTNWGYAVRYGLQTYSHHPFEVALGYFNVCVDHALACAGYAAANAEDEE